MIVSLAEYSLYAIYTFILKEGGGLLIILVLALDSLGIWSQKYFLNVYKCLPAFCILYNVIDYTYDILCCNYVNI